MRGELGTGSMLRAWGHFGFMALTEWVLFSTGRTDAILAGLPWLVLMASMFVMVMPYAGDPRYRDQPERRIEMLRASGELPSWPALMRPITEVFAYGYAGLVDPGLIGFAVLGAAFSASNIVAKLIRWKNAA